MLAPAVLQCELLPLLARPLILLLVCPAPPHAPLRRPSTPRIGRVADRSGLWSEPRLKDAVGEDAEDLERASGDAGPAIPLRESFGKFLKGWWVAALEPARGDAARSETLVIEAASLSFVFAEYVSDAVSDAGAPAALDRAVDEAGEEAVEDAGEVDADEVAEGRRRGEERIGVLTLLWEWDEG